MRRVVPLDHQRWITLSFRLGFQVDPHQGIQCLTSVIQDGIHIDGIRQECPEGTLDRTNRNLVIHQVTNGTGIPANLGISSISPITIDSRREVHQETLLKTMPGI